MSKLISLYECLVSKRGKGAKGTASVKTFGRPDKKSRGVTKTWSYSHAVTAHYDSLLESAKKIGNINEIIMRGADAIIRSSALKSQSQVSILVARIVTERLAMDYQEARSLATSWLQYQAGALKSGMPVPSIDDIIKARRKACEKLRLSGWEPMDPNAETEPEPESDEPEEVDDADEPEDTDEPEESESETPAEN